MKQHVGILDTIPAKRMFMSIIADYDLSKSICELVDNALDVWTAKTVKIRSPSTSIWTMTGGRSGSSTTRVTFPPEELRNIVGPGQSGSSPTDETIGIFGGGTKRAVVALAKQVRVTTRHGDGKTYQVEFDDSWLQEEAC